MERWRSAVLAVWLVGCGGATVANLGTAVELCTNGLDDDGDGNADCADPACFGAKACRPVGDVPNDVFFVDGGDAPALGPDAATPVVDAGLAADAGASADAGAAPSDAGLPWADAGTHDAGAPTSPDAGSPCQAALTNPALASDAQLWACATTGGLRRCSVATCSGGCACTAYVRSSAICTAGSCAAPLSGSGCADGNYYAGAPLYCSGPAQAQAACLLRGLIARGLCQ